MPKSLNIDFGTFKNDQEFLRTYLQKDLSIDLTYSDEPPQIVVNKASNLDEEAYHLKIDKDINSDFTVYHNEINNDGIIKSVIDKDLLKRIHKNYHFQAIKVLEELCPQKLKLYEYSDFTIIITRKDSKFPIHDDTPNKLLSGVVYLLPENNSGTVFYDDKNGEGKTEMGWKQNRAVFFSRKEKTTFKHVMQV